MYRNLSPGAIGVDRFAVDIFSAARKAGFQGLEPDFDKLLKGQQPDEFRKQYQDAALTISAWGLPVALFGDEGKYREGLANLRAVAQAAASVGALRTATWVPPASTIRPFEENFRFHVQRICPVAELLAEHGICLGLEFIGPKTSREGKPFEFIYTMDGMLELAKTVGTGNVGLLLDSWHWYTSHGTISDLLRLKDEDIVQVHINDAPAGISVDEQIDNIRAVMGDTGVIDLDGFLQSLQKIGYTGPVTPEPFSRELNAMAPADAVDRAGKALFDVWEKALT